MKQRAHRAVSISWHTCFSRRWTRWPAGGAHERVVVERCGHGYAQLSGDRRQVKRQVQQIVHVQHVGPEHGQQLSQPCGHQARPIGVLERLAAPVVDDLHHRQPLIHTPVDVTVIARRVVFGAEDRDVVPRGLRAGQLQRIDFRSRLMARRKIVYCMENVHEKVYPCRRNRLLRLTRARTFSTSRNMRHESRSMETCDSV